MKKIISIIILACLALPAIAQPTLIDEVVAQVGNKIVLMSEIEIQYLQYTQNNEAPPNLHCLILDRQMTEKMLLSQAERDSVKVSGEEVDMELDRRIRYFISMLGSKEKLEEYYNTSILEIKEDFREDVRNQLLAQRMQSQITGDVKITPNEVEEFFNDLPPDSLPYFNAEVQVGQIVMYAKPSEESERQARKKLLEIKEKVKSGLRSFKTAAILYSEDPGSASEGGIFPEFSRSDPYYPEFIGASFKLNKPGDISDIVETSAGFHLIELVERKGERVTVRHILIRPEITEEDLQRTKKKMERVYKMLENGEISFTAAVSKFSDDEATKNTNGIIRNPQTGDTRFEIDALGSYDASLPFTIDKLEEGDYSQPKLYEDAQKNHGYRIVYLKSETEPHVANMDDDYARIKEAALAEKKDRVMQEWMNDRIKQTYIKIDSKYQDCSILKTWLQSNP